MEEPNSFRENSFLPKTVESEIIPLAPSKPNPSAERHPLRSRQSKSAGSQTFKSLFNYSPKADRCVSNKTSWIVCIAKSPTYFLELGKHILLLLPLFSCIERTLSDPFLRISMMMQSQYVDLLFSCSLSGQRYLDLGAPSVRVLHPQQTNINKREHRAMDFPFGHGYLSNVYATPDFTTYACQNAHFRRHPARERPRISYQNDQAASWLLHYPFILFLVRSVRH